MSFIDDSKNNVKKYTSSFKEKKRPTLSLKEVTGAGGTGGFVGRGGHQIDQLFAGPWHPDYNEVEKLLKQQLAQRKKQDKNGTANPVGGYYDVDTKTAQLAYDELDRFNQIHKQYSDQVTPPADIEWKSTGWDYHYDEPGEAYKIRDIVYDDNSNLYAGDNFINKSATNWKFINRENM